MIRETQDALSPADRASLLDSLQRLRSDADQLDASHVLERLLPLPAHERALSRDVMVVRGERGGGKSKAVQDARRAPKYRPAFASLFGRADDADVHWVEGFSEGGTAHPTTEVVARFVEQATLEQTRVVWMVPDLRGELDPNQRPARWRRLVSEREHYDVERVGWRYEEVTAVADPNTREGRLVYDTTREGMSNVGHTFGAAKRS